MQNVSENEMIGFFRIHLTSPKNSKITKCSRLVNVMCKTYGAIAVLKVQKKE